MDIAKGWKEQTLSTGTRYYYHNERREFQVDPPYYEILGLDPLQCDKYGKSEIRAAWFKKKTSDGEESGLVREAYERLRHTNSRVEYNHRNIQSHNKLVNSTGLYALSVMLN